LQSNSPQLDRFTGLTAEIQGLLPIAEPARKNKKLPVDQLKAIIRQLCDERWLATSELAALVDRDADKLQTRFLTAMVKAEILELRYPDVRNRPDQAYRSKDAKTGE
jgi:ATP-dependent DNA helicase RecG